MIDPSRARRIVAGAAASVFAVAAAAGMAAGMTAGVTAVTAAGVTVAGSTAASPGIRADSKIRPRCFAVGPIRVTSTSPAPGRHVSYVLTADRQPGQVRPSCFHRAKPTSLVIRGGSASVALR
jgi:hypothetical protein